MDHKEFINKYKKSDVKVVFYMDFSGINTVMNTTYIDIRDYYIYLLGSWIWLLCFIAAIPCFIWVNWWTALLVLVFVPVVVKAILKHYCFGAIIKKALIDEEFYNKLIETKVLRVS